MLSGAEFYPTKFDETTKQLIKFSFLYQLMVYVQFQFIVT
jgi:hypothetical protein